MAKQKRLGVVEDDAANVIFFLKLMSPTGLHTHHALLGFDFVLLVIRLPDISGLELAKVLRKNFSNLPIIVLTAYANIEAKLRCNELGIDFFSYQTSNKNKLLSSSSRSADR